VHAFVGRRLIHGDSMLNVNKLQATITTDVSVFEHNLKTILALWD
jgi:hypothetical protein